MLKYYTPVAAMSTTALRYKQLASKERMHNLDLQRRNQELEQRVKQLEAQATECNSLRRQLEEVEALDAELLEEIGKEKGHNQHLNPSCGVTNSHDADQRIITSLLKQALNKPATFDGSLKSKLPIRDWLGIMQHYLHTLEVPANLHVAMAVSYLRDEALRYWHFRKQLMPDEQPPKSPDSWQDFHAALTERFDPGNTPVTARYQLDKLQQRSWSMPRFIQRFDQLCPFVPTMTDDEKIHRFLTSVRPECAAKLKTNPQSGRRWTHYNALRGYALNEFADTSLPTTNLATDVPVGQSKRKLQNVRDRLASRRRPASRFGGRRTPALLVGQATT